MTLTITLTPELENQLHENASAEGIDAQAYVISLLEANLQRPRGKSVPHLSADESRLLIEINAGLPDEVWRRFQALVAKRRDETISQLELDELIQLSEQLDRVNVERFARLVELARIRQVDVQDLMRQLEIPDPGYV